MQSLVATPQFWIMLAVRLVGVTFLWTGAIKAIAPRNFQQHLGSLGWVPYRWLEWTVAVITAVELGLGAALVLGVGMQVVLPATAALLVVLSCVSWWGVQTGKTADCGCYGGYIQPSIWQSPGLNATFAAVVLGAFFYLKPEN